MIPWIRHRRPGRRHYHRTTRVEVLVVVDLDREDDTDVEAAVTQLGPLEWVRVVNEAAERDDPRVLRLDAEAKVYRLSRRIADSEGD